MSHNIFLNSYSHSIAWRKRGIVKAIIIPGVLIVLLKLIRFLLQLLN
ncbi:damage-inducible type I toxin DinQ [Escherichia sp. MOD1-EC7003]